MHDTSILNFYKCYKKYITQYYNLPKLGRRLKVLDVGGANVNGSYRDFFHPDYFEYRSLDLEGENVDILLSDPYVFPIENAEYDIVISGQAFEHIPFFWKTFEEMTRVLDDAGLLILIAPSAGPIHKFPVDCYRFYPDAYKALADYVGINLIEHWREDLGVWRDLVGVFSKRRIAIPKEIKNIFPAKLSTYEKENMPVLNFCGERNEENEVVHGSIDYLTILKSLHTIIKPCNYLEIGVRKGKSLKLAGSPTLAIDPFPQLECEPEHVKLYKCTSDDFFEVVKRNRCIRDKLKATTLCFIDGMHLFEYVLRDFIHVERFVSSSCTVVVDDIFPCVDIQASRMCLSHTWMGDVWKFLEIIKKYRPDLDVTLIDSYPSGLLLIRGLNNLDTVLSKKYNGLVEEYKDASINEYKNYLNRSGSLNFSQLSEEESYQFLKDNI